MMLKIVELVGSLAPVAGLVLMLVYRRRAPRAVAVGAVGAMLAAAGSLVGLVASEAMLFGGDGPGADGTEGMLERLEGWGLVRLALLLAGTALLVIAAFVDRTPPHAWGWVGAGLAAVAAGAATSLVHIELASHPGLTLVVAIMIETVRFGLLGAGLLLLSIAVVAHRGGGDGWQDPEALARRAVAAGVRLYRERGRTGLGREAPVDRQRSADVARDDHG